MKCSICGGRPKSIFEHQIMNKYQITYYKCSKCQTIFTEKPFWVKEAYDDGKEGIADIDTGVMVRNLGYSKILNALLSSFFPEYKSFVDVGGGHGIFTRLMRDLGFDYLWADKYCNNIYARGFEYRENQKTDFLSAFEVMEHLESPLQELEQWFNIANTVLVSTQLAEGYDKEGTNWWYFNYESGQHITFYSKDTFQYLADYFGKKYIRINNSLHLLTDKALDQRKIQKCLTVKNIERRYKENFANGKAIEDMNYLKSKVVYKEEKFGGKF